MRPCSTLAQHVRSYTIADRNRASVVRTSLSARLLSTKYWNNRRLKQQINKLFFSWNRAGQVALNERHPFPLKRANSWRGVIRSDAKTATSAWAAHIRGRIEGGNESRDYLVSSRNETRFEPDVPKRAQGEWGPLMRESPGDGRPWRRSSWTALSLRENVLVINKIRAFSDSVLSEKQTSRIFHWSSVA